MTCEFAHLDGAYVIGSLAASERAEYERHLAGCDECSRSVRELAGLPGLMSRVSLEVLEPSGEREPVPDTLFPAVVAEVRRSRRRRLGAVAAVAAAAAVIVVAGVVGVVVTTLDDGDQTPEALPTTSETTATAERMQSLGSGRVSGWVSLTEKDWGTRIDLTCTYRSQDKGRWAPYVLFVRTTDGKLEQVGSWRAKSGAEMHVTMATAAAPEDIEEVVVKTDEGRSVLRLVQ